jgi:2-oxoglutarate dehydrogenase E2 component (dihydrolipoamide succinyltransferase)
VGSPTATPPGDARPAEAAALSQKTEPAPGVAPTMEATTTPTASARIAPAAPRHPTAQESVERVPMTLLRRRIAERLVEAQRTAAILTTFNEVDCTELLDVRRRYRERFRALHGVDLGLMSLFARAVVLAVGEIPALNARIDSGDIVYHHHVHLGIAVSTPRGLVVPVVRHAQAMSLAALERAIGELAGRAREGRVLPDQLAGGTFSITNGGVFGSLLSTPILNPPQSGILGMHRIQERPVAVNGQVVIHPMMYVALSYDHRLVDGEQAVTFLVRVKERIEDPVRMLLEV